MGLLKSITKAVFRRAFTQEELLRQHAGLLANISLPGEAGKLVDTVNSCTGGDMRGLIRDYHTQQLREIGQLKSWELQRRKAIELCLMESS